jgi:hypothetical protein
MPGFTIASRSASVMLPLRSNTTAFKSNGPSVPKYTGEKDTVVWPLLLEMLTILFCFLTNQLLCVIVSSLIMKMKTWKGPPLTFFSCVREKNSFFFIVVRKCLFGHFLRHKARSRLLVEDSSKTRGAVLLIPFPPRGQRC